MTTEVDSFSTSAREGASKRFPEGTLDWFEQNDFSIDFSSVTLLEEIAKGSYGTVYKSVMQGKYVAVKIENFHEGDEEQVNLLVELSMLQCFPHDRLVRFYGAGLSKSGSDDKVFFVSFLPILLININNKNRS